jgi:signal transduction histidine kinase
MMSELEEIGKLMREDEKLNKELTKVERKIDNYYNRKDEAVYKTLMDEAVKTIVIEEPPKSKKP